MGVSDTMQSMYALKEAVPSVGRYNKRIFTA
jgi:hypothetical protein